MTTAPPPAESLPAQPLPFRLLLDEAVRQSRRHFRRIYPAVAIPLALVAGLVPLSQWLFFRTITTAGRSGPSAGVMIRGMVGFWLVMMLYLAAYWLGYLVLFGSAIDALAQRPLSMAYQWRRVLRPAVFGTLLLSTVVTVAGFMACILPGIYLGLLFSLTLPVIVDDGLLGTAAMRRSAELTRYNPQGALDADPRFKVFVVLFVGTLLGYVIGTVVQLPMIVVQQVMMLRETAGGRQTDPGVLMAKLTWLQVPSQILAMLTSTAVHLYVCFGLALLYVDVKRRREGVDLEAAVARLVRSHLGTAAP